MAGWVSPGGLGGLRMGSGIASGRGPAGHHAARSRADVGLRRPARCAVGRRARSAVRRCAGDSSQREKDRHRGAGSRPRARGSVAAADPQRIKEQAGIENSIIAGSHTHHGPVLELTDQEGKGKGRFDAALRYYGKLEDGIVAAIVEANSRLAPARMAVGSAQLEGFNRNRHTKIEPKPSDRELAVMRFDDAAGKPVAILVNFAAHPTMLPASMLKFSADYVGALKAEVTKETAAAAIF